MHGRSMSGVLLAFAALFPGSEAFAAGISRVDVEGDKSSCALTARLKRPPRCCSTGRNGSLSILAARKGRHDDAQGSFKVRQAQFDANTARVVLISISQPSWPEQFAADGRSLVLSLDLRARRRIQRRARAPRKLICRRLPIARPRRAAATTSRSRFKPQRRLATADLRPAGRPLVVIDAGMAA